MNYNIFSTNHHFVSNSQKSTMSAICEENSWKLENDDEKYLARLKKHIKDCNRADFDTDQDYHHEISRRTDLYRSEKEVLYLRRKRMTDYLS